MQRTVNRLRIILFFVFTAIWFGTVKSTHSLLTAAAIILHETGHIIASAISGNNLKFFSVRTVGLTLSGEQSYRSYYEEAFIASSGPFLNFLSALLCLILSRSENALFFSGVSFALGTLNLLPIKDFDGGRITEAFLYGAFEYNTAHILSEILSFLALFFLWSISVYALLRSGESLTLFIFSSLLFSKMFFSER